MASPLVGGKIGTCHNNNFNKPDSILNQLRNSNFDTQVEFVTLAGGFGGLMRSQKVRIVQTGVHLGRGQFDTY